VKRFALAVMFVAAFASSQSSTTAADERAKRVIAEAVAALGGDKFLAMEDRIESGRAYSFYNDRLSGLSIAKIYTRYLTPDPARSGQELAVRERQSFGKDEVSAVVFREDGAANITYRGPKALPKEDFERYRESTLRNVFYIFRQRMKEPGLTFESRGSEVVDRLPCEVIEIIDAQNHVVTVYFHQVTKLPVKQVFTRVDPKTKDRIEEVTRFDRYREDGGIQWPRQVTRERNGDKIYQVFAESVVFNQNLTDDLFSINTAPTRKK
jgi:hypothetical protein